MIAAILLAAGRSIRLGRDKPSLELNGETLVERHLRQLRNTGVDAAVVVCNQDNDAAIGVRSGARTVVQKGAGMTAAVATGLQATGPVESVWAVCVNDIVADSSYARIAALPVEGDAIVIPTRVLDRTFHGGRVELSNDGLVRAIIEKPEGGCPAGSIANIMVHRLCGARVLRALERLLADGVEYEAAINTLIDGGVKAYAVPLDFWMAIKTAGDLDSIEAAMRRGEVT